MINNKKIYYTWQQFDKDVANVVQHIKTHIPHIEGIYAIPKGGLVLGVYLANVLELPLYTILNDAILKHPLKNILVVDEISDTGSTLNKTFKHLPKCKVITLWSKEGTSFRPDFRCRECKDDIWVVYPWEELYNEVEDK